MTTADTTIDIAKLEAAEDKLKEALDELLNITERKDTLINLDLLAEQLNDALDCLQIGLGRPYVWLLNR
jgi:hypothetical protein